MLRLRNTLRVPQNGWIFPRHWTLENGKYTAPINDGAELIKGGDFPQLVERIVEYRVINNLPLGDASAEAQDWICRHSGAPCVPANVGRGMLAKIPSGADLARFLYAMAEWMRADDVVPQEEAERRAEICAGCPFNCQIADQACFGCFGLLARIMRIIGQRKTRMDQTIKFCGHCGCSLHVVVFAPLGILNRTHANDTFPEDIGGQPCWRKAAA